MNPDPLEPIVKIGERLREKAAEIGLDVQAFAVLPDFSGGTSHALQVVFTLTADAAAAVEPQLDDADIEPLPPTEWDDDLAGILAATDEAETEKETAEKEAIREAARQKEQEQTNDAVQRLLASREKLTRPGGFLEDDE